MQGHFSVVCVIDTALIHLNPDAHGHNLNGMNEGMRSELLQIKRARRVSDMAWPLLWHGQQDTRRASQKPSHLVRRGSEKNS